MNKLMKIVSDALQIILTIIIIICIYSFISLNILGKDYVNYFSYTVFSIGSNSMAPTITTNDLIIVKLTKNVEKGDIITFKDDKVLVTHRIIGETANGYITKGDANNTEDKNVSNTSVIGKVVKILPNYGTWFKVITTPKIIIMICTTVFLFSIAFSYTSKRRLGKNDDFAIYYSGIKMKGDKDDK